VDSAPLCASVGSCVENRGDRVTPNSQILELLLAEMLDTDKRVLGGTGPDEFVQLDLDGSAVSVL
jgi:hypothetical protein